MWYLLSEYCSTEVSQTSWLQPKSIGLLMLLKVIDEEEDISDEEEKNSEILVADGDNDHPPIIDIYELLMNREFIDI